MFISMYSILNSYITSNKVGGDMSVASVVKLFGVIGMCFIIISRTFEWSIRYETCPNFSALYLRGITYTHGNFHEHCTHHYF